MGLLRAIVLSLTVLASIPAFAVQPDEVLPDPVLESRARALSQELRCLVCQNQSIDDSDAQLARDLRILLRERLKAGDSNRQVLDFLVARYGEFVLLRPPFEWHTALLWLAPGLLLLAGAFGIVLAARRRLKPVLTEAPLSAQESARLRRLTDQEVP
jgi:cytochrome c-type biogenesis protein CcmH